MLLVREREREGKRKLVDGLHKSFIGRDNLSNEVRGHYHGQMSTWSSSQQRLFGVYLLHKAYLSFKIDTPQPIYPSDL